jgi:hypothetical protein
MAFVFKSLRRSWTVLLPESEPTFFPVFGATAVFLILPGRLGIVPAFHATSRIARRSSACPEFPAERTMVGDNGNYRNGRKYAFKFHMDPILEYQRSLLLTVFACWGIALILAASMKFLVRNAEAWKSRLLRALFPEPSAASESFAEQVFLPLDFRHSCPNCRQPMLQRRTRNLRHGNASLWGCSQFPHCRGTRIEMRGRAVY